MDNIFSLVRALVQGADEKAQRTIIDSIRNLTLSLEAPEDTYGRLEAVFMELAMAKTAVDLKLFDHILEKKGPSTTSELAEKTSATPVLLGRLLRCLVALSMIKEIAEDTYEGNHITEHLTTPLGKAMAMFSIDVDAPLVLAIPGFLKENGYDDITDPKHCPL
ncbi:MAG: hypothetical protein LQ340_002594 [Diploschistes diacapsis]|nr:MAG: hypothetical protein LQ340_002594 [Diploschistes diacapsis]